MSESSEPKFCGLCEEPESLCQCHVEAELRATLSDADHYVGKLEIENAQLKREVMQNTRAWMEQSKINERLQDRIDSILADELQVRNILKGKIEEAAAEATRWRKQFVEAHAELKSVTKQRDGLLDLVKSMRDDQ